MFYTDLDNKSFGDNDSQNVSVKIYEYVVFVEIFVSLYLLLCYKFYRMEWRYLFNITNTDELRVTAINANLRTSRFRSVCWRLLLEILPPDSSKWLIDIEKYRSLYEQIKSTHYNDPHTQDSGPDDPLSQDEDVCFFSPVLFSKYSIVKQSL